MRDLLVACPSLLRRSTRALQERYQVGVVQGSGHLRNVEVIPAHAGLG